MEDLITAYDVKMTEAGCSPGSGLYGVEVSVANDISPVFPYLNALLAVSRYDHDNGILIWREGDLAVALRRHQAKIAQKGGIGGAVEARRVAGWIVERLNDVWRRRDSIAPCLSSKEPPPVADIFRLLPKAGCKKPCGYTTCLTFAADLRAGSVGMERCSPLFEPANDAARQKLVRLLSA